MSVRGAAGAANTVFGTMTNAKRIAKIDTRVFFIVYHLTNFYKYII